MLLCTIGYKPRGKRMLRSETRSKGVTSGVQGQLNGTPSQCLCCRSGLAYSPLTYGWQEERLMGRENDDQATEYGPTVSIFIWLVAGLAVWVVALLLFTIL